MPFKPFPHLKINGRPLKEKSQTKLSSTLILLRKQFWPLTNLLTHRELLDRNAENAKIYRDAKTESKINKG